MMDMSKEFDFNKGRMFLVGGDEEIEVCKLASFYLEATTPANEYQDFSISGECTSIEIPCDMCEFDLETLLTSNMVDNINTEFKSIVAYKSIQNRINKKKRINKKWLKKYGVHHISIIKKYSGEITNGEFNTQDRTLSSNISNIKEIES